MEYRKFLGSKKVVLLVVGAVVALGTAGLLFYAQRVPTYKMSVEPTKLLPFVSHAEARGAVCGTMQGQLFDEICGDKFNSVGKNDAEKIGALFSLLKQIENDRGASDYERLLLAQAVFASLPTKDSPLAQNTGLPIVLAELKDFVSGKNIAYAKGPVTTTGMGEEEFKITMTADLKEVINNLPEGDNAWTIMVMVSKYQWVNGKYQPLYSQTYGESYDPYPSVSTEDKSAWEQYDMTHIRSRVGAFATNQTMFSGPLTEGSGTMIGYSFTLGSWKSHPYGSDSVLVLAEAGPAQEYMVSRRNYSDENYSGDNLLSDLLRVVKMPSRQQTAEGLQEKGGFQKTVPPHGTPVSKSDYGHIIDQPGCDPWAVYPETGIYCFTEEELNAIGASGDLGRIRDKPPTYPFFDGNEPWRAPIDSPTEQSGPETPPDAVSQDEKDYRQWLECVGRPAPKTRAELEERERQDADPSSSCYDPDLQPCKKAADGTCIPGVTGTTPR